MLCNIKNTIYVKSSNHLQILFLLKSLSIFNLSENFQQIQKLLNMDVVWLQQGL